MWLRGVRVGDHVNQSDSDSMWPIDTPSPTYMPFPCPAPLPPQGKERAVKGWDRTLFPPPFFFQSGESLILQAGWAGKGKHIYSKVDHPATKEPAGSAASAVSVPRSKGPLAVGLKSRTAGGTKWNRWETKWLGGGQLPIFHSTVLLFHFPSY